MKKKIYSANFINGKEIMLRNILMFFFLIIAVPLSAQNPYLVSSPIPPGPGRSIPKIVTTASGKAFFNTMDNNNLFDLGLWVTDGTRDGTTKFSFDGGATLLTPLGNDKIVFAVGNISGYGDLWISDGTVQGTTLIEIFRTFFVDRPAISGIASLGNVVVYGTYINETGLQLRKTDGTPGGTTMVYDFGSTTVANPNTLTYFKTIGNLVYFVLTDGITHRNEIWRSDGTTAGTYQVRDIGEGYNLSSDFMVFKNNIYFITTSATYGDYIWKSDGTNAGTVPLKQISTSSQSGNINPSYAAVENNMILANNLLYFTANDGTHGKELWKTDGTEAGTVMTFDFYQGAVGSNPNWLTVLNNQLYFTANSSFFPQGTALYFYNGLQFSPPIGNSVTNPSNLAVQNNTILFSATGNASEGNELWGYDGSNTFQIANINPVANASSNPSLISVSGNNAYFVANYDANRDGLGNDLCIFKYAAPQKIWTGNVSSDPADANNWSPAGVPTSADNVLFPVNATNPVNDPVLFLNDFVNNGSTVNVGSGHIFINGNVYNEGTVNNTGSGIFSVSGATTSDHTFGSPGIFNGQVTLSGTVNLHLNSSSYIPTFRIEGKDTIYAGPYSLTIDKFLLAPAFIILGSGSLSMPVGNTPVTFPIGVGNKSYTPVTITNNSGVLDYFNVSMKEGVFKNGITGDSITREAVNKTWDIYQSTNNGSPNANITLQWNAADELPGFDRNSVYLNHYTSGAWDSGTPGIAGGLGPYTFTRNGITSFSPFSISSSASALPVDLVSFIAGKTNNAVQLSWQTSSEKNASFYVIERSADGNNFSKIGQVAASGGSSIAKNYLYTDNTPAGGTNFYRLKMVDTDGKFIYSKTIAVREKDKETLQIFPNPVVNILYIQAPILSERENEHAMIQIFDAAGRKVKEEKIFPNDHSYFSIDIQNLPKGVYHLLFSSRSKDESQKFVKE